MPQPLPIGSITIRHRVRFSKTYSSRFIKISHHGPYHSRWMPYARYYWQQQHKINVPDGYRVAHRDGDGLNDSIQNLVLVRENAFSLALSSRASQRKRRVQQAKAVAKSNRRRARVYHASIRPSRWYLVLPSSKAIVWVHTRTQKQALSMVSTRVLSKLCEQDRLSITELAGELYDESHEILILTGQQILDASQGSASFDGFLRLIPDTRKAPKRRSPRFDFA